jgi:hypothetical protein
LLFIIKDHPLHALAVTAGRRVARCINKLRDYLTADRLIPVSPDRAAAFYQLRALLKVDFKSFIHRRTLLHRAFPVYDALRRAYGHAMAAPDTEFTGNGHGMRKIPVLKTKQSCRADGRTGAALSAGFFLNIYKSHAQPPVPIFDNGRSFTV